MDGWVSNWILRVDHLVVWGGVGAGVGVCLLEGLDAYQIVVL